MRRAAALLIALVLPGMSAYESACERHAPNVFGNASMLADRLGDFVVDASKRAVAERGRFVVAIAGTSLPCALRRRPRGPTLGGRAGGSLPATLANALLPRQHLVDWARWDVWMVDERHVPVSHADSNYKACVDALFGHVAVPRANVHAANAGVPVDESAREYQAAFVRSVADGRFDLVLLGMGPDGHVASLFPGHALLGEVEKVVAPIADSPKPPPERITFTLPVLNRARECAFVVVRLCSQAPSCAHTHACTRGRRRAQARPTSWRARSKDGASSRHPWWCGRHCPQPPRSTNANGVVGKEPTSGALHWFLDAEAASML